MKIPAVLFGFLVAAAATSTAAAEFMLTSPAFKDGGVMAKKHGGNVPGNANCVGENVSPALSWTPPPDGTKSLTLVMVDPEGLSGLGVVHWVAYDIAPATNGFAEGEVSKPSDKYVGGKGTRGEPIYLGPCPTAGSGPHHYAFTLIATDLEPGALKPGLTRDELLAALKGHAKMATGLVGLYAHSSYKPAQ
ncbi:MAG: YbhB/YbcL family Raf kinase inhibitor-like protein [Pseudolabrys sp.]|nr:YbhB/YbcL family Raf kinase inhibitor-like protein [Pseudolabrys sp.]